MEVYCVCQQLDSGIMIECIRGSGGCNGWVHPQCCGLVLTQEEIEQQLDNYICPMCETSEDYGNSSKKNLTTKQANEAILALRRHNQKQLIKTEPTDSQGLTTTTISLQGGEKWSCGYCTFRNDPLLQECMKCFNRKTLLSTVDGNATTVAATTAKKNSMVGKKRKKNDRRSLREKKQKRSYHIPASDEEIGATSESEVEGNYSSSSSSEDGNSLSETDSDSNHTQSVSEEDTDVDRDGRKRKKQHKGKKNKKIKPAKLKKVRRKNKRLREPKEATVEAVGSPMVIEKIMGSRIVQSPPVTTTDDLSIKQENGIDTSTKDMETEYYIKWKGFAYVHASWEKESTLRAIDANNKHKIKRFEEKLLRHPHQYVTKSGGNEDQEQQEDEKEYFNPDFIEIDRILGWKREKKLGSPNELDVLENLIDDGQRFFIKWRGLAYSDATWERYCDLVVQQDKEYMGKLISKFQRRQENAKVPSKPVDKKYISNNRSIREYKKLDESPAYGNGEIELKLRDYQLEGLNWLMWNWHNRRASILADEMGLGKTIQTLAFLDRLVVDRSIQGPFLVVAPLSLIAQWQNECETWTSMNSIVYHGSADSRQIIRDYEFYYFQRNASTDEINCQAVDRKKGFKFNLLVTTFEIVIKDIGLINKIQWKCLIVDEAHRLKNQKSRLFDHLGSINREHCLLLTGTPLQNRTEELWALMHFLDRQNFSSVGDFLAKFGDLQNATQVADLHRILKPYLLRRIKEDVEKALPPKEETIVEVELTPVQKKWYRAIYEKNTTYLASTLQDNLLLPNLMNVTMELRKCCNHPYLNNGVEEALCGPLVNTGAEGDGPNHEVGMSAAKRNEMLVDCCGKMVLLDKLLPRLKENGHKVLIFSQMVRVLDILEDYLRFREYLYERLDGRIRGNLRQAAVDRFVKDEYRRFVMLLSTKAGGLGLNLTAADTVIIYDSDWNPQNDLQAQARAHRIGQTQSVKIYRLITKKTYEMHMFHKASLKLGLDRAVLTHMRQEEAQENEKNEKKLKVKKVTKTGEQLASINELLKKGAYDVFRDDDKESEQFCASDIDAILARSVHIVQYEANAKLKHQQSSFSKASFVTNDDENIDIDDPDFWKKAVGLEEQVKEELKENELILPSQRKRTRVSRFGSQYESQFSDEEKDPKKTNTNSQIGNNTSSDPNTSTNTQQNRDMNKNDSLYSSNNKKQDSSSSHLQVSAAQQVDDIPREWTANARERLQRALMHYGFGRWSLIRSQSGGSRTLAEVEMFCRIFLYHCGICCLNEKLTNTSSANSPAIGTSTPTTLSNDSVFVQSVIKAAEISQNTEITVPTCLTDGDYGVRLKQGGARRVLQRLDLLQRLQQLVAEACDLVEVTYAAEREEQRSLTAKTSQNEDDELEQPPDRQTVEIDQRVEFFGVEEISENIQVVNMFGRDYQRPGWTKLTPWWDEEADRDLLMGVFLHGYGRCTQLLADSRLCFYRRQKQHDLLVSTSPSPEDNQNVEDVEGNKNESEKKLKSTFKLPEVQQINRLLVWLLSAEDIKREREENLRQRHRVLAEQRRQEAQQVELKRCQMRRNRRKALEFIQMDLLRHEVNLYNHYMMRQATSNSGLLQTSSTSFTTNNLKDWSKAERRSLCLVLAALGVPQLLNHTTEKTFPELTWQDVTHISQVKKSTTEVVSYVEEKLIPKCQAVSTMKLHQEKVLRFVELQYGSIRTNGVSSNNRVEVDYVDALEPTQCHGLKAQLLARLILRRQKLFTVLRLLVNQFTSTVHEGEIMGYLKSEESRQQLDVAMDKTDTAEKLPLWWCPWIHDYGLMLGFVKHGIYAWSKLKQDYSLPFHSIHLSNHIEQVLLLEKEKSGSNIIEYEQMYTTFPSFEYLENRVQTIASRMGELFHADSPQFQISLPKRNDIPPSLALDERKNWFKESIWNKHKERSMELQQISEVIKSTSSTQPQVEESTPINLD